MVMKREAEFMGDSIYKNENEVVRLSVGTHNGKSIVDFRVAQRQGDGTYQPTQRGFVVPTDSLEKFSHVFDTIRDYVDGEPGGVLL